MPGIENITVNEDKFSIDKIDDILMGKKPGKYVIFWLAGKVTWEIRVKWDGENWVDGRYFD